jgi:DnaJ-class molecular chaperone
VPSQRGKLLVTVTVDFPDALNEAQRNAIAAAF